MAVIKRQHHNLKLAQVLNSMLQCGSLVDVTIYCDDGQVNAHKLMLAASSTYFRNLFSRMTNPFQHPIIALREIPINDLKTIIQFIYQGSVEVPHDKVDALMRYADYLQIDGMASSTNSLNAILASAPMASNLAIPHQPLLASIHPLNQTLSATTTNVTNTGANISHINSNQLMMNKLHTQYPPTLVGPSVAANSKQSTRGQNRRNNNNNNNNNSMNNSGQDHSNNTGKPRHSCNICLKTFTHGFTLKRHMELHSDRVPVFCDVCSKSYSCKDSFLRHKKSSGHLQHADFHHVNTNR